MFFILCHVPLPNTPLNSYFEVQCIFPRQEAPLNICFLVIAIANNTYVVRFLQQMLNSRTFTSSFLNLAKNYIIPSRQASLFIRLKRTLFSLSYSLSLSSFISLPSSTAERVISARLEGSLPLPLLLPPTEILLEKCITASHSL